MKYLSTVRSTQRGELMTGDAEPGQAVEGVEPEDHLLERPAGDRAHDHRAAVVEPDAAGGERGLRRPRRPRGR